MQKIFKNNTKYLRLVSLISCIYLSLFLVSCKKFIEVDTPVTSINTGNVYSSDNTASAVLTGILAHISNENASFSGSSLTSLSLFTALSADELTLFNTASTSHGPHYRNDLTSLIQPVKYWEIIYPYIFNTNSAIEGVSNSSTLTVEVKNQLLGEAKFLRAFFYFYLVNLYGDVPLALTTDPQVNRLLSRSAIETVYGQIIADLKDAKSLLSTNYLKGDAFTPYPSIAAAERVRPTKWAATALLARVYLFKRDYVNAESESTILLNNSTYYTLSSLNNAFLKNSNETIWSLSPVRTGLQANTGEGAFFILPSTGPNTSSSPVYLNNNLISAFESGDLRKLNWTDSVKPSTTVYYYAKKYKIGRVNTITQEYIMILRLAEQYLIRAEARANQNNLAGAISDVDKLRQRAGLPLIANTNSGISKAALIDLILHERQVELFTEWGHRWLDLKRTERVDAVMNIIAPQKGGTWQTYKALFPIPQTEIDRNPNLVGHQNPGY